MARDIMLRNSCVGYQYVVLSKIDCGSIVNCNWGVAISLKYYLRLLVDVTIASGC